MANPRRGPGADMHRCCDDEMVEIPHEDPGWTQFVCVWCSKILEYDRRPTILSVRVRPAPTRLPSSGRLVRG